MIELKNINPNESGLSVRGKLNNMFTSLITGDEGVNKVWTKIQQILNSQNSLEELSEAQYEELKEQVLKSFDYTDTTANDLTNYINAINGGVSGFAESTEYNPNIPEDKAATILAVGAGTYTYFKDSNGTAITIKGDDTLTIFYKAANSTYWQYKSILGKTNISEIDGGNAFN